MRNSNKDDRPASNERNGPESKKLLKVPSTPTTPPSSPVTPTRAVDDLFRQLPITEETSCGIWCFRGPNLQRFANKKAYVFLYGVLGCIFSASYAYFNGTITTIEKRFKIPSKTTGFITVGNDISQLLVSVVLSYYAGKGHRPRWIAVGIYTVVLFCCLTMLPHFLYGPGEDALLLTKEYGAQAASNQTTTVIHDKQRKSLCLNRTNYDHCEEADGNFAPQVLLFIAQLVSGIGGSLYYTLGVSYMDDNIQKSKTPALISFSYFLRMLGPAIGYGLASFALKFYISPTLTPTITMQDPRWLGAWWLGWIILAILLFIFASILALFPKTLPRAAARKALALERNKSSASIKDQEQEPELPASLGDMMRTFRRLLTNTTLMCNNLAAVFYFMGYMPYWIFMPKYIETQYKQSASVSSLITGTVGLVFSAFGILLSGLVISKYKPRARYLAGWNVMVGAISVLGMISYAFLGCPANDNQIAVADDGSLKTLMPCNEHCHCDYVTYNPVCSENGQTFISACHAGCKTVRVDGSGAKVYTDCSCIKPSLSQVFAQVSTNEAMTTTTTTQRAFIDPSVPYTLGSAVPGSCSIDCLDKFYIFLAVVCLLKFSGATGRASNFLVSVRCVDEKDKTVAMGFSLTIMSLFAFIPSPILFGFILDKTCLVWGKTCSGTGNCWLYNGETLRYLMNFTAATFVTMGTLFDVGVWYYVKDVKIFDEEVELEDIAEEPGDI
ncbi:solute carrier organic anion transporter family member 74D [Nasonia vitripennis]|uniref:Solute carrier organic anion transporter family member n=1 Tax=Nasonia vitripennis TaxID=7425 RepID=A0A7M7HJK3_NASVI|nr:solute carrier organic anion transporter family member 74D [Nasonia vitripennis]XP_008217821.1 solute carrier organic anion transporter family member 74D [Nasonia vitripennis]XP_008217822.1 solute carrier organic anion transporter family member 74D [Nasonia vitripennis]XP_008217823.1 solute carrier organic anion transporter family member 74D [Nasonia vitripennis]XP_016838554.1 solute carrier organic anion transporter family member 74D [Nasonia vitripennis]XP_032453044.1 solute carrier organ